MNQEIAVRYSGERDRHKISQIILLWCSENNISAECSSKRYMHEDGTDGIFTTTFWNVPGEKERIFFMLRWGS